MNIEIIEEIGQENQVIELVKINHNDREYTIMPKSVYDEQQAALAEKPTAKK